MPIPGLQNDIKASLPRLFVLKKGDEKKGNRPGPERPWWRAHAAPGANFRAIERFYELPQIVEQDGKPTEIACYLTGDTRDEVADPYFKEHGANKRLVRRCTGEVQDLWLDDVTGNYCTDLKPCEKLSGGKCACSMAGHLNIMIEGLPLGYVKVETGSDRDVRTIDSRLKFIEAKVNEVNAYRAAVGMPPVTLAAVPCVISRVKDDSVTYNDNGQRKSAGTKYFIELAMDGDWYDSQMAMVRKLASMRLEDFQAMQQLLPSPPARGVALIEQKGYRIVDGTTGEILDDDDVSFDFDSEPEVDFMEGSGEGEMITQAQMDEIDDLGREIFGPDEWLEKAVPGFRHAVGRDDIGGRGDLTKLEAGIVLTRLRTKQKELAKAEA